MSLFDDLLSDERQQQRDEAKKVWTCNNYSLIISVMQQIVNTQTYMKSNTECHYTVLFCNHSYKVWSFPETVVHAVKIIKVIINMQEDESYGQELLERIETTIALLGMSHQQRRADLKLENFEYKGSNIGKTKGVLYVYMKSLQFV